MLSLAPHPPPPILLSIQVSDWERRPLSEGQAAYAALDAHSSVLILRGIAHLHHPFSTPQGLDAHAFDYRYQQSSPEAQGAGCRLGAGPPGGGGGQGGDGAGRGGGSGGTGGSTHGQQQPQQQQQQSSLALVGGSTQGTAAPCGSSSSQPRADDGCSGAGASGRLPQQRLWASPATCSRVGAAALRRALLRLPRQLIAWRAV